MMASYWLNGTLLMAALQIKASSMSLSCKLLNLTMLGSIGEFSWNSNLNQSTTLTD